PPTLARPRLTHPYPTRAVVIILPFPIPEKLHPDSTYIIRKYFLSLRPYHLGDLWAIYLRFGSL
ncbi:hypothetical protein ACLSZ5_10870, partial [Avibacterium avium]|uniref:hypothetical protein n=1 Tax=Avibacterium avium TaxID=751 RepID=UPI003BF867DE